MSKLNIHVLCTILAANQHLCSQLLLNNELNHKICLDSFEDLTWTLDTKAKIKRNCYMLPRLKTFTYFKTVESQLYRN